MAVPVVLLAVEPAATACWYIAVESAFKGRGIHEGSNLAGRGSTRRDDFRSGGEASGESREAGEAGGAQAAFVREVLGGGSN